MMFRVNFAAGVTEGLEGVDYLYQMGTGMLQAEGEWAEPEWEEDPTLGIVALAKDDSDAEAALAFTAPDVLRDFLREMQRRGHLHFVTTAMRIPIQEMQEAGYDFDIYVDPTPKDFLQLLQDHRVLNPSGPGALAQRGRPEKKEPDAAGAPPDRQHLQTLHWTRTVAEWDDERKRAIHEQLAALAQEPEFDPGSAKERYAIEGLEKAHSGESLTGLRRVLEEYLEAMD